MKVEINAIFKEPALPILLISLLFMGCYLYLGGYLFVGSVISGLCLLFFLTWLLWSFNHAKIPTFINILFLLIVYSPYIEYGKEIGQVRYFGSAYAIDFQQYLSVVWSLITQGVPFKNPYLPTEGSTYHYGFMVPLASILRLSQKTEFYEFFSLSNYLFIYQIFTAFVFLQFLALNIFKGNCRRWIFALAIMFIFSSYKWIYAIFQFFLTHSATGFDTPFGFKTPANDFLFGSHYVFSMLFVLYIFNWLSEEPKKSHSWRLISFLAVCFSAFILPAINVFSLFVVAAICMSTLLIFVARKKTDLPMAVGRAIAASVIPFISYFGYLFFVNSSTNQGGIYFSFSIYSFFLVIFSLIINFGPLIYFFLKGARKHNKNWLNGLISVVILIIFIATFRISSGIELDDSFNVSRRLGTSIGWLMLIVSDISLPLGFIRWLIYPAALTFIIQYFAFFILDFKIDSRNERVDNNLFNAQVPYYFSREAWSQTGRVSFNFNLILGDRACGSPNSIAATRYTRNFVLSEEQAPINKCLQKDAKEIIFKDGVFRIR